MERITSPLAIRSTSAGVPPSYAKAVYPVEINYQQIATYEAGGEYNVTLLDGLEVRFCVTKRTERTLEDYSLSGFFKGEKNSLFSLVVKNEHVSAIALLPERKLTYKLEHNKAGDPIVYDINQSAFPPCALSGSSEPPQVVLQQEIPTITCQDKPDKIDVLVVYTQYARSAVGSDDAIQAECQLAVDLANTCYENSKINTSLRLVAACEVYYNEYGDFADHLDRVENQTDGYMDEVHALRDRFAADVVCLMVESMEYCGIARLMGQLKPEFEAQAFSVVSRVCASSNLSFVHEIGHNQGCAHNREDANNIRLYPYSYGWRFAGMDGERYRTVMAYDNEFGEYTRIPYFSNPDVSYQGIPTGVLPGQPNEANNALTINNSASTVASFRQSDFWLDFGAEQSLQTGCEGHPFTSLKCALEKAPPRARVFIAPGKSSEKMLIKQPVELIPINGLVILGYHED